MINVTERKKIKEKKYHNFPISFRIDPMQWSTRFLDSEEIKAMQSRLDTENRHTHTQQKTLNNQNNTYKDQHRLL